MSLKKFELRIEGPEVQKSVSDKILKRLEDDDIVEFLERLGICDAVFRVYEDDELQFSRVVGSL